MSKEVIAPTNVHKARGYSHAFKVSNTIYMAAQAPVDQEMKLVGKGDIVKQTEQVYENIKRVLEAAGATTADIVKVTYYLKDLDDMEKTGPVFAKYFQKPYPPATALQVIRFPEPDFLIEVDAIAVINK